MLERLKSGVTHLDDMVATGWLRGTATMVAGPSGSGKTSIGLNFLKAGAEAGEPGLLVSFQENPTQLARMMRSLSWSPEALLRVGAIDHLYVSPVGLQRDWLGFQILERLERGGARRVVVDAVSDLERTAADGASFHDFLYSLTQALAVRNVTCMLLLETSGELPGRGASGPEVSYMSDNILVLSLDLGQDLTRTIRIIKSRGSAHDGRLHVLRISADGVEVV